MVVRWKMAVWPRAWSFALAVALVVSLIQFPYHAQSHAFDAAAGGSPEVSARLAEQGFAKRALGGGAEFHLIQFGDHDDRCGVALSCVSTGWFGAEAEMVGAPPVATSAFLPPAPGAPPGLSPGPEPKPPRIPRGGRTRQNPLP